MTPILKARRGMRSSQVEHAASAEPWSIVFLAEGLLVHSIDIDHPRTGGVRSPGFIHTIAI